VCHLDALPYSWTRLVPNFVVFHSLLFSSPLSSPCYGANRPRMPSSDEDSYQRMKMCFMLIYSSETETPSFKNSRAARAPDTVQRNASMYSTNSADKNPQTGQIPPSLLCHAQFTYPFRSAGQACRKGKSPPSVLNATVRGVMGLFIPPVVPGVRGKVPISHSFCR